MADEAFSIITSLLQPHRLPAIFGPATLAAANASTFISNPPDEVFQFPLRDGESRQAEAAALPPVLIHAAAICRSNVTPNLISHSPLFSSTGCGHARSFLLHSFLQLASSFTDSATVAFDLLSRLRSPPPPISISFSLFSISCHSPRCNIFFSPSVSRLVPGLPTPHPALLSDTALVSS